MLAIKPALSSLSLTPSRRLGLPSRQARTHIVKGTRASIALPNQHGIWLDSAESAFDVLYGQNFVVQRPKRGGPGLVLSPRFSAIQILKEDDHSILDVTEYSYVEKARLELPPPRFPLTQETGVVLHSSSLVGVLNVFVGKDLFLILLFLSCSRNSSVCFMLSGELQLQLWDLFQLPKAHCQGNNIWPRHWTGIFEVGGTFLCCSLASSRFSNCKWCWHFNQPMELARSFLLCY